MNVATHFRSRPWMMLVALLGLFAGHAILFYFVGHSVVSRAAVPGALVSGVVLLVIAKHLGLLTALLRTLHRQFRRRSGT